MKNHIKRNPRTILNKIKWDDSYDIHKLKISYIHRGAFENIKNTKGEDIKSINKSFFETDKSIIPFHRILIIKYDNKIIFKRMNYKN